MQEMYQRGTGLRASISGVATHHHTKLVAVGVATAVLTPVVLPFVKPVIKATIKSGLTLFEETKGAIAETGEVMADIIAEARAESQAELEQKATLQASLSGTPSTSQPNT